MGRLILLSAVLFGSVAIISGVWTGNHQASPPSPQITHSPPENHNQSSSTPVRPAHAVFESAVIWDIPLLCAISQVVIQQVWDAAARLYPGKPAGPKQTVNSAKFQRPPSRFSAAGAASAHVQSAPATYSSVAPMCQGTCSVDSSRQLNLTCALNYGVSTRF